MKDADHIMRGPIGGAQTFAATPRGMAAGLPRRRGRALVSAMTIVAAAMLGTAWAQLPPPQTAGGVEYITGGFGADMSEAFKAAESDYPLALVFAATDEGGGSRPYLADVSVVIKRGNGEVVMEVPSAGPYLLMRLEPGPYAVEATYMGKTQTHNVTVKEGGPTRQVMTWERP